MQAARHLRNGMLDPDELCDGAGQPHILFPSSPIPGSMRVEDHYRDAAGWHVRTFPLAASTPLAMTIDANNTTHIVAIAGSVQGTTRLVYARIDASRWN
jgi:hypothetical protein